MSRENLEQVGIRETTERKPSMTRRNPENCRRNQGRFYLLGQVCQAPDYGAGGDRRIGGRESDLGSHVELREPER